MKLLTSRQLENSGGLGGAWSAFIGVVAPEGLNPGI